MSLRLISAPTEQPITLTEAKKHCRVDGSDEDTLIETYIAAATAHIESVTGRAIMDQTWEVVLDDFSDAMMLPKGPAQSVTSVKYFDTSEVEQTLATDQYVLDNVSDPAWVVKAEDATYPEVAEGVNNVIIRFVAGYSDLPAEIKAACLILVAALYDNRADADLYRRVENLLVNHRSFAS